MEKSRQEEVSAGRPDETDDGSTSEFDDDEDAVAADHPIFADLHDTRGSGAANLEVVAEPPSYPLTSSPEVASDMYETARRHFSARSLSDDWLLLGYSGRPARSDEVYLDVPESGDLQEVD